MKLFLEFLKSINTFKKPKERLDVPLSLLACFALFSAWQMGVIYFSGTALSLFGRTPVPLSILNMTALIAAGYVLSILFLIFFPHRIVEVARASVAAAFVFALTFLLPLPPGLLAVLYYGQCFCCVFIIGVETGVVTYLFNQASALRYIFAGYAVAEILIAVLHNDFVQLPFSVFHSFSLVSILLLGLFFFSLPLNNFISGEDTDSPEDSETDEPLKKYRGYALCALGCFMTLFGTAVAETVRYGVMTLYLSAAVISATFYLLMGRFHFSLVKGASVLVGLSAFGFMAAIASLFIPPLAIPACAFLGGGIVLCIINPFYGLVMMLRRPSRFIAPITIGIAFVTVLIHSALLEAFREQAYILYAVYLLIAVAGAILYLMFIPTFIRASKKEPIPPLPTTHVPRSVADDIESFGLTHREKDVCRLLLQGLSVKQIAYKLNISFSTANTHYRSLYKKLGVSTRSEFFLKLLGTDEDPLPDGSVI